MRDSMKMAHLYGVNAPSSRYHHLSRGLLYHSKYRGAKARGARRDSTDGIYRGTSIGEAGDDKINPIDESSVPLRLAG